jgi:Carbohydrate binding domain (family 11)
MSRPTISRDIGVGLLVAMSVGVANGVTSMPGPSQSPAPDTTAKPVLVIRDFKEPLAGACTSRPGVNLSVGRDVSFPTERVLVVEYPEPTKDPAGRDVQCAAQSHDWTAGGAIAFQIKPTHALRLSVSFMDRNHVAYTTWTDLKGDVWQLVRIPFQEMRPNPYFQPPDAKTGAPIDVSAVEGIAFAPQDRTSGRLSIRSFVVTM